MGARWLGLAALAAALAGLTGCGESATSGASDASGSQLSIYSSLPLQGPTAAISEQIVNGEKLALAQAGGRAGSFKVGYVSLDDSNPTTGRWDPGVTATDAKTAAQDTSTIAYLGDFNSAATAVSLPLINAAGILQVSPSSPYVGLTSALDAGQDEPGRFYPTAHRTFARTQPGDPVEASAQVQLMQTLGVHELYVLDNQDPFDIPLSDLVAERARQAGIKVAAHDSISAGAGSIFTGEVEKVVASGAQAVFFSGSGGAGSVALWQALHRADPHLLLLGSSAMDVPAFTSQLAAAGPSTYLTTPILAPRSYPPSAARVLAAYRSHFAGEAGPYALYGYETMRVVLDAIRAAGAQGNDRTVVIARLFATRNRDSAIGRYSIGADGETTLSRYGVDRVVNARAVPYRSFVAR